MRVLVCGGRDFRDRGLLFSTLYAIHRDTTITLIIQGGATGADALAKAWADYADVPCEQFDADWNDLKTPPVLVRKRQDGSLYNALAGPNRNTRMLKAHPDLVVAFEGGRGTMDMISQARAAGVSVREVTA